MDWPHGATGHAEAVRVAFDMALVLGASAESLGVSEEVLREVAIALPLAFGVLMIFSHPFRLLAARLHWVVNRAGVLPC